VCVVSTASGDMANTDMVPPHPNRKVIFLDNSTPVPFLSAENEPTYEFGFSISKKQIEMIDEFDPTIVHLTCPDCTALHLVQYARDKEVPILGSYHSNLIEYMEHYAGVSWVKHIMATYFKHQYSFFQALYVPTPYIQNYLSNQYQMDCATNVKVWGHGVDLTKFHPTNRSEEFRRKYLADTMDNSDEDGEEPVILLWVSRLVPEKRPDIFGNVVRRLTAKGCNFHAVVVGAGTAEHEVKQLPNTTYVSLFYLIHFWLPFLSSSRIISQLATHFPCLHYSFCGWMNEDQLSVAYASSDIFLFPSAVETFGLVTLEAAASGLPVIVEEGCSGHLVQNGESGYACPEADEEAFFNATYDLVTNHEKRRRFSQASRQLSLQWENGVIVRRMMENYATITQEFYTDYEGHHANRDAHYRNRPGAFRTGNHPRSFLLIVVEFVLITLFNGMFTLANIVIYAHKVVTSRRRADTGSPSMVGKSPSVDDAENGMVSLVASQDDLSVSTVNSSAASTQDETTESSGDAVSPSESKRQESAMFRTITHGLTKSFMQSIEFQMRLESGIRNVLCGKSTLRNDHRPRKDQPSGAAAVAV